MSFEKLKVWQRAMQLVTFIYEITAKFPREEIYGLTSQMRRAAVSVPSNIAEGSQRTSNRDFANFILIAKGSLAELQTQITIAKQQSFFDAKEYGKIRDEMEEISKMLYAFHHQLLTHKS